MRRTFTFAELIRVTFLVKLRVTLYHTGDYLVILPSNPIEIVYRVLKRFNLSTDTQVKILSSTNYFLSN